MPDVTPLTRIADALLIASNISALPAIIIGWKSRGSLLWFYALTDFASDAVSYCLKTWHISIGWPSNAFLVGEFLIVGLYLVRHAFQKSSQLIMNIMLAVIAAAFCIHTVMLAKGAGNYIAGAMLYVVLMVLCMAALYRVTKNATQFKVERSGTLLFDSASLKSPYIPSSEEESESLLFDSAFLIYASGASLILLFKQYLDQNYKNFIIQLWLVVWILNIAKNIVLAIVLSKRNKASPLVS